VARTVVVVVVVVELEADVLERLEDYAAAKGDYPLALRLFLAESWTSPPERMQAARVPLDHQSPRTKNEIALDCEQ
jgi:hypothetical protein